MSSAGKSRAAFNTRPVKWTLGWPSAARRRSASMGPVAPASVRRALLVKGRDHARGGPQHPRRHRVQPGAEIVRVQDGCADLLQHRSDGEQRGNAHAVEGKAPHLDVLLAGKLAHGT